MAEKEPQGENIESAGRGRGKWKWSLIPMVLILLGAVVTGGAKMGFITIPSLSSESGGPNRERQATDSQPGSSVGVIYPMKAFIVNLADEPTGRYLKVRFEMELDSRAVLPEIEKRMAQLTDSVIMLLSGKTSKEIATYEGKDRMRNELLLRLNSFLRTGSIRKIYFTEFMMQ